MHSLADILRARIFAIACGWEDADDLDSLRFDPAFKLACGRLPDSGRDLCPQPAASRVRLAFAAACPEAAPIHHLATRLKAAGP